MFIYWPCDALTFADFCNIILNMYDGYEECLHNCSVALFEYMAELNTESDV